MATAQPLHDSPLHAPARIGDGGPLPAGADVPAHRRFERVARARPGLTAVVAGDVSLTYGELDARAGAIAARLHELGAGREDIVGICLPRRLDALIAILGVLRAGAAYLPLDVAQPLARRRFMLGDAGAAAVITVPELEAEMALGRTRVLAWGGDAPSTPPAPDRGAPEPDLRQLAYVMYTSGSTGRPKGVLIEHRSLAAFVHWGISSFSPEELERTFAATSFGFDISLFELMVPLAVGGTIVLADSFRAITRAHEHEPTLVNTVPSLMAAALKEGPLPASVRTAILAGEPLRADVADSVHDQPGVTRVVNAFGPTEDTVYSTAAEVHAGEPPDCGRPLPGTQVHVVGPDLRPVPHGDEGEVCLAGAGIARGYLGREDLTRERFAERPLGHDGPERMYRTGDLGRLGPDGSLHHLGRLDNQIKLHGVRIEPGEIEQALVRHPDVQEAAVVARERRFGGKWLVAYLVCRPGADPEAGALRELLRETLPDPMVPGAFVKVGEMPLNPSGKLDRARLPEPRAGASEASDLSADELTLARLWRDVLELEHLPAAGDDFFELGGTSLLAFELFDRIGERFGVDLPPSVLLEAPTLRLLALAVGASDFVEGRVVVELHPDGERLPCFYVHSGAGGILALRHFATGFGNDQPLYGIQAFREADTDASRMLSIPATAAECVPLVRERQPHGPYVLAGHSIGGHIAYELACLLEAKGEEVLFLGLLDPAAPHTLRWRGRVAARGRELLGAGPESRRSSPLRAAFAKVGRRLRAQAQRPAGQLMENDPDRPSDWMRMLMEMSKRYSPSRFSGRATVYRTVEMARYTGSGTLGWERYVRGPVDARPVPGGHVSLLLDPNVQIVAEAMEADIRAAQRQLEPRAA